MNVIRIISLLALLTACSTQPVVTSQARAGAQLASYKTYAFKASAGKDSYGNASIASAHLKAAIDKELASRGYSINEANPDIVVDFSISMIKLAKKSSGPTINLGMFGSRGGVSLGVPVNGGAANYHNANRIILELLDTKRREVVWEGAYEGVQSEQNRADPSADIYIAVNSIFRRFPIK